MKSKVIGILAAASLGFSAQSFADYNVYVPTSQCSWSITSSGTAAGQGGAVSWYNASLNCPSGSNLATKSGWTAANGQSGCSVWGVTPYIVTGNCNSFTLHYVVVEPPTGPEGAACTWTTNPTGGNGSGNVRVEFYSPIGQCRDRQKVIEYRSNIYYSTYYVR